MQDEITDAVGLLVCPPPYLVIGEQFQAPLDLRQEVFGQVVTRARDKSFTNLIHCPGSYSSSNSSCFEGCLCFAFLPAGRAFSSGFACVSGWPGGATGRRIEPMIDCFFFRRFAREDFIVLAPRRSTTMLSLPGMSVNLLVK